MDLALFLPFLCCNYNFPFFLHCNHISLFFSYSSHILSLHVFVVGYFSFKGKGFFLLKQISEHSFAKFAGLILLRKVILCIFYYSNTYFKSFCVVKSFLCQTFVFSAVNFFSFEKQKTKKKFFFLFGFNMFIHI